MNKENRDKKGITVSKEKDFSGWYTEVVQKAELADYAPIRGFMVIRPDAYSIWEIIQKHFDKILERKGVKNAYFPLLIPESFFRKEAEHAKGFAPELAYIDDKGEGERLAIRPTSETIMYDSYSKWIRSYRDLPLKINQWCNVLRWEVKQTKPFIRTREFLWQEGHCVFESEQEAEENVNEMIGEYKKIVEELLAIPVILGEKSQAEKFAGAKKTMTIEALMPDGKALQCGTSHNLGQNFAKSFNVSFIGRDEKSHYAWQTSWGFSTRLIGALIMVHGDNKGLVLPPRVAKNKAVIVPIYKDDSRESVIKKCREIKSRLSNLGCIFDDRVEYSPGWKFNEWELKGVPLRIEVGPKDIERKQVVIARRDNGKKESISEKDIEKRVLKILDEIQNNLFDKAKKYLDSHIDEAGSMKELQKSLKEGNIVKVFMVNEPKIEMQIKEETGATSRIVQYSKKEGRCIKTGQATNYIAYFSKSY